jgi:hypothetical protein
MARETHGPPVDLLPRLRRNWHWKPKLTYVQRVVSRTAFARAQALDDGA